MRYTFQVYAVNQFQSAARISTIAVVRAVVAAAAQPVYAKISDYFGRISILIISVIFYLIGTIVSATAKNFGAFSGGAVIYQFGYTGLMREYMASLHATVISGDRHRHSG